MQNAMEAQGLKQAKAERKKLIGQIRKEEENEKRMSKQRIQDRQREAKERIRMMEEAKKAKARAEIDKKVEEENKARMAKESLVERMEQEELELIQRLQNTQMLQRSAYEDLELALAGQFDDNTNN